MKIDSSLLIFISGQVVSEETQADILDSYYGLAEDEIPVNRSATPEEISSALYEICDSVHASCNPECPVYAANNNSCVESKDDDYDGCDCFKDGYAMKDFLVKAYAE